MKSSLQLVSQRLLRDKLQEKLPRVTRGVARIFSEGRTIFQIQREQLPPPPFSPIKTVATQGHSQTDFHDRRGKICRCQRREIIAGLGVIEGDIGVCGVAVLLSFLCGIPVNKIPHCGVEVISNPTVCDV